MSDLIAKNALGEVGRLIFSGQIEPDELMIPLKALQRRGLSKPDLLVHVERIRAFNDATNEDEQIEENCLVALDLIEGQLSSGLVWDAAERAAAWVPRVLSLDALRSAAGRALLPSDLLPSRPGPDVSELGENLARSYWTGLQQREYIPTGADFFRSPKTGLTTRPAALLAPKDRFVLEALVEPVAAALQNVLPAHVRWPRGLEAAGDRYQQFVNAPINWDASYVVRTDVSNFYEAIDHAYLSVSISRQLRVSRAMPLALESFLDAVMQSTVGVPQGPVASDVLASCYLLDIDLQIEHRGWSAARYADDFLIAAHTVDEAKVILRELETMLRDRGLSLSSEKTRILRKDTYESNLGDDDASDAFDARIAEEAASWFEDNSDADTSPVVSAMGLPEEIQWDVLYHHSVSWADALANIEESVLPPWIHAYERVYQAEAARLEAGGHPRAQEALTVGQIRRCLLFMAADPRDAFLNNSQVMLDWHPTIVREMSRYLGSVARVSPDAVASFVSTRMLRPGAGDLEIAWLVECAIGNDDLAERMREVLHVEAASENRPLAATTALRALVSAGHLTVDQALTVAAGRGQALGAEFVLSLGLYDASSVLLSVESGLPGDVGTPT